MRTPICDSTCPATCSVCDLVLHNMSVPSTSRITVARAPFPGLRFCVRFPRIEGRWLHALRDGLAKGGWRKAWTVLEGRGDAPTTGQGRARRQEDLERHLLESLHKAGVPDRLGVFIDEFDADPRTLRPLPPAATPWAPCCPSSESRRARRCPPRASPASAAPSSASTRPSSRSTAAPTPTSSSS